MIQNRESFLQSVAARLGRSTPSLTKPERNWKHLPQHEVLKDASMEELIEVLREQCLNIHTTLKKCTKQQLPEILNETIVDYGGGRVIYSNDPRFGVLNVLPVFEQYEHLKWQSANGKENIDFAEQANVGVVISNVTLAESGTIMLQASPEVGRTISFLSENSIAVIPKSSIVPRMTQAAQFLREQSHVSSCINFITGPSNSADIEMNLVVGVHGPVRMTYILVEDY
ncbi:LutC/YkgG family protein [Solibacillus sp. FSL K6-1126]|uniref:LutC/YkgG family protein n=1 Tax=Solibacillus sp. FSL K6-1126 TaxID=2921463 RepID=UPI0030F8C992